MKTASDTNSTKAESYNSIMTAGGVSRCFFDTTAVNNAGVVICQQLFSITASAHHSITANAIPHQFTFIVNNSGD